MATLVMVDGEVYKTMDEALGKVVATYKIGTNKGRPRIWIDGKRLAAAGFVGGTMYWCAVRKDLSPRPPGLIVCSLTSLLPQPLNSVFFRVIERKVTGRSDGKPIIDLLGADVEAAFPGGKRVKATFSPGKILIEREE